MHAGTLEFLSIISRLYVKRSYVREGMTKTATYIFGSVFGDRKHGDFSCLETWRDRTPGRQGQDMDNLSMDAIITTIRSGNCLTKNSNKPIFRTK